MRSALLYFALLLFLTSNQVMAETWKDGIRLQSGDDDTIACFDDLSMSKYRERCSNNFPELKGEIETAFQGWRTANAARWQETKAACRERLTILNKNDPVRLDELKRYVTDEHTRFIAKIDSSLLANARADCKSLINELTDPQSAWMIPEYLANRIRTVNLKSEFVKTNFELKFGESPIALDLRLITDEGAPNSEILKQTIKTYSGDRIDNVPVQKSSLIGEQAFNSLKLKTYENDGFVFIGLSTTPDGAKRLEEATRTNIGKRVALVLKEDVLLVATIREEIPQGGTFGVKLTVDRAKEIAEKISAALMQK